MTRAAASASPARTGARRIALLGAGRTGKSWLAQELATHLRACGLAALAIPEPLQKRGALAGPMAAPGELLALAEEQERRFDAAAAQAAFVIADTTALMVAVHASRLAQDAALYRFALDRQRTYDATLLTGLDLAWAPDDPRHEAAAREAVDLRVRQLLQEAGVPYQVVYGQGGQRLQSALQSLAAGGLLPPALRADEAAPGAGGAGWVWVCDKCSDPGCEHRLFTKLRDARP